MPSLWAEAVGSSCLSAWVPADEGQQAGPLALQDLRPVSSSRQSVGGRVGGWPRTHLGKPSPLTSGLAVDEESNNSLVRFSCKNV